jgi:hypothetical protein
MVKKAILLLSAAAGLSGLAHAQRCATDEIHQGYAELNPRVTEVQQALEMYLKGATLKTTAANYKAYIDSVYEAEIKTKLIIPVVVHVVHDYGNEFVSDDDVRAMIGKINDAFQAKNPDVNNVIPVFKPYIGNANFELRLARKDPQGKPTIGITRHYSYLTKGGDDQAKFDQWAPDRYLNIWIINKIGRGAIVGEVAAYATLPAGAANFPYNDGVITGFNFIDEGSHTVAHEVGHYFNLFHTWGNGQVEQGCGGEDEVDDTPPTTGHFTKKPCALSDTICSNGYHKIYTFAPYIGAPLQQDTVNYPDTNNTENIMDYSSCTKMFTKQQVLRMRNTLKSSVASRANLLDPITQTATGINDPASDLSPIPEFSLEKGGWVNSAERTMFMCANLTNKTFLFKNQSWRDTVTEVKWEFSNGGGTVTQTGSALNSSFKVTFTEPGWATVKMTATSNAGSNTIETKPVYVADPGYIVPAGNYQEFNPGEYDRWPAFNYYSNQSKWEVSNNTGFFDKTCIVFKGYDTRTFPETNRGNLGGDYDDFFTPAYDLSSMATGECNINFMSSGVFRTTDVSQMNDKLELAYSIDCGETWRTFDSVVKKDLGNKGSLSDPYAPLWHGDWKLQAKNIPTVARTGKTFFRFRYKPSVCANCFVGGTNSYTAVSNNFYIDRINVSSFPLGVNTLMNDGKTVAVAPNPTSGSSFVVINGNSNEIAKVQVTDLTGKVVYSVQQQLNGSVNRIEIPASAISVKGIYLVQVVTGTQTHTEKLVSY